MNKNLSKLYQKTDYLCIYLTNKCNMHCSYCFNSFQQDRIDAESFSVSDESLYALATFVNNCTAKIFRIAFFGGEPLIKWENAKIIHAYLSKHCPEKDLKFRIVITALNFLLTI